MKKYTYIAILLAGAAAASCQQKALWWGRYDEMDVTIRYNYPDSRPASGSTLTLYVESENADAELGKHQERMDTAVVDRQVRKMYYAVSPYWAIAAAVEPKGDGSARAIQFNGSDYQSLTVTTATLELPQDSLSRRILGGLDNTVADAPELMWSGHREIVFPAGGPEPFETEIDMNVRVYTYNFTIINDDSVGYLREVWGYVSGLADGVKLNEDPGVGGVTDGRVTMRFSLNRSGSNQLTGILQTFGPARIDNGFNLVLYGITNSGKIVTINGSDPLINISNAIRNAENRGYANISDIRESVSLQRPIGDPETGEFVPDVDPWEDGDSGEKEIEERG